MIVAVAALVGIIGGAVVSHATPQDQGRTLSVCVNPKTRALQWDRCKRWWPKTRWPATRELILTQQGWANFIYRAAADTWEITEAFNQFSQEFTVEPSSDRLLVKCPDSRPMFLSGGVWSDSIISVPYGHGLLVNAPKVDGATVQVYLNCALLTSSTSWWVHRP